MPETVTTLHPVGPCAVLEEPHSHTERVVVAEDQEIRTTPRHGAKLRIEQHGPISRFARVWLNDQELTGIGGGLMGMELSIPGHGLTVATLKIGVDELEVDAETMVALQAVVRKKYGG